MCTIQDIQGKLGTPKPDQCRSGVRGVFFDKQVGQLKIFLDMHQSCVNATGQKWFVQFCSYLFSNATGFVLGLSKSIQINPKNLGQFWYSMVGIYFFFQEKSWVARWSNCGMKTYAMFNTEACGVQHSRNGGIVDNSVRQGINSGGTKLQTSYVSLGNVLKTMVPTQVFSWHRYSWFQLCSGDALPGSIQESCHHSYPKRAHSDFPMFESSFHNLTAQGTTESSVFAMSPGLVSIGWFRLIKNW